MPDKRPRGYQPGWRPRLGTLDLLGAIDSVLARYEQQLPLTIRQVWYVLLSDGVLVKAERTYKRLVDVVGMGRRSGRIAWDAIRDDSEVAVAPPVFDDPQDFLERVVTAARGFRLDRQSGQAERIEIVCETAGMVPQIVAVADPWGIPVYSGSGFNSLPGKRGVARRAAAGQHGAVRVLVVSDWDPSGIHLFTALAEDVAAFAAVDAPGITVTFERIAVTEQQITDLNLPTAPVKQSDHRSFPGTSTTQAEALPPDTLARILNHAITRRRDTDRYRQVLQQEHEHRQTLLARLEDRA
ncbi:hypothetical protein AB0G73_28235 [Streptomyces sp. NPDC020719]|uniref:hypothetical protein n=1 Tax=Streptomyces sp. NPDC020719 TaxID=3154896 RepID=UPI00340D99F6